MPYIGVPEKDQKRFARAVEASRVNDYVCPTNAEEYWAVAAQFERELIKIITSFVGDKIRSLQDLIDGNSIDMVIHDLITNKDKRAIDLFNSAWAAAPDSGEIHLLPGWNVLCDLCSESHLVLPEQE